MKESSRLAKRPVLVGHRGSPFDAPENTIASIRIAFHQGADAVEVDVRLTRDGVPFLMHDDTLDRTTTGTGPAASATLAELRKLKAISLDSPGEGLIPTLSETADAARGRGQLLLDLKQEGMGSAIAGSLARARFDLSEIVVGAWTSSQVKDALAHLPGAKVLHAATVELEWDRQQFSRLRSLGVHGVEVWADEHLPLGFVEGAHAAGLLVYTYPVNDEGVVQRHLDLGVDGIETDRPETLVTLVSRER